MNKALLNSYSNYAVFLIILSVFYFFNIYEFLRDFLILSGLLLFFIGLLLNFKKKFNILCFVIFTNLIYVTSKTPYFSNFFELIILVYLSSVIYFNFTNSKNKLVVNKSLVMFIFVLTSISILGYKALIKNSAGLLTILGMGYDNSAHISAFRNALLNPSSLLITSNYYDFIPNSLFLNYPDFYHVVFGSIFRLIFPEFPADNIVVLYFISITGIYAILILSFFELIKIPAKNNFKIFLLFIFAILVLCISQFSILFTSGYPHNIFSIAMLLLLLILISTEPIPSFRLFYCALFFIPITFTTPQLLPTLIVITLSSYFIGTSFNMLSNSRKVKFVLRIFILFLPILISIFGFIQILIRFSPGQILAEGGIEPFRPIFYLIYLLLFIFSITTAFRIKDYPNTKTNFIITLFLTSCVSQATAITLILFSFLSIGEVSYYALKSVYFSIPFTILYFMYLILTMNTVKVEVSGILLKRISSVGFIFVYIFILVLGGIKPTVFMGGFMSPLPVVTQTFMNSELKGAQLIYGPQILAAIKIMNKDHQDKTGIIVSDIHGTDLNSRWLNGLNGTWTDDNWALFYNADLAKINYSCSVNPDKLVIFSVVIEDKYVQIQDCVHKQIFVPFTREVRFDY